MKKSIKVLAIALLFLANQHVVAQSKKEMAMTKCTEAVKLMDSGKIDESIILLNEAIKLDPDNFNFTYELSLAYYFKEDYKRTIEILEKVLNHKEVTDQAYQLLGNSYDLIDESSKAFEVYDAGLKKFPNSGKLYLEKGNVYWAKKKYEEALPFYEKGIEVDPSYPSNYYRATLIYCSSTEEIWGMIYGEIFMNLERNSKRTKEISKLLFNTYKNEIKLTSDSTFSVSFCQQMTMNIVPGADPKTMKLPFGMIYETNLMMSLLFVQQININSLDTIRTVFLTNYFDKGHNKTHPNALFDYQKKIQKAGHIEAYNHWILMQGDVEGFNLWASKNKDKYDKFIEWFIDNGLVFNKENRFYKGQY